MQWYQCHIHKDAPEDMRQQKTFFMIPDNLQKSDLVTTKVQKRKFVEPDFANESSSDEYENHDDAKGDKACKRKFDELIFLVVMLGRHVES